MHSLYRISVRYNLRKISQPLLREIESSFLSNEHSGLYSSGLFSIKHNEAFTIIIYHIMMH
jgi:hypothetical protein